MDSKSTDQFPNKIYSAKKLNPEIKYAKTVANTLRDVTIFVDLLLKGSIINIFIMTVAGVQRGAVIISANPPPIAAAASAYGLGNNTADK